MNLDLVFPLCTDEKTLANDIATFFTQKIEKIRLNLGSNTAITDVFDQLHSTNTAIMMTEFKLYLTETEIRALIESVAKKSCPLDPIPTRLLVSCLDVLLPVITKMVNLSLYRQANFLTNRKPP